MNVSTFGVPLPPLTAGQRVALENLALKKSGKAVDWITIADARALTEIGLAERNQSGWQITPRGEAFLAGAGSDDGSTGEIPPDIGR